jgi:hypothetical protein
MPELLRKGLDLRWGMLENCSGNKNQEVDLKPDK